MTEVRNTIIIIPIDPPHISKRKRVPFMRILRLSVLSIFLISLALYIALNVKESLSDDTLPIITASSDFISVPLDATDEDILRGITAWDEKDGDITDKVVIESVSRFVEPGISVVKYAVCDSDRHVATLKRRICYENYESPHFTLSSSLVFGLTESFNVGKIIGAHDVIDGNISKKVIVTSDDYSTKESGLYYIMVKVTNSKGDMISLSFPSYIEDRSPVAPEIRLGDYIVYRKLGEAFDAEANVVSVLAADGTDLKDSVEISSNVNELIPGVYEVHYRAIDTSGRVGHEMTLVVVES